MPAIYGNILHPDRILFVTVEQNNDQVQSVSDLSDKLIALGELPESYDIPVISCGHFAPKQLNEVSKKFGSIFSEKIEVNLSNTNLCEDTSFIELVAGFDRNNLLLIGTAIEGHLSIMALSFLQLGYDVFVLAETSSSRLNVVNQFSLDRLMQAGVVPLTVKQVLLELQSH